jgi:hypothetical protein
MQSKKSHPKVALVAELKGLSAPGLDIARC